MNDGEFNDQLDMLVALVRPLMLVDVEPLRRIVEQAEVLGPIVYPAMYRNGGSRNAAKLGHFLTGIADFQAAVKEAVK